jgi:hypothetical protein
MSGYGTEQPVCLAVDPVREVQDIGVAVVASDPEVDRPEAASPLSAVLIGDRAVKLPVGRVEVADGPTDRLENERKPCQSLVGWEGDGA